MKQLLVRMFANFQLVMYYALYHSYLLLYAAHNEHCIIKTNKYMYIRPSLHLYVLQNYELKQALISLLVQLATYIIIMSLIKLPQCC